jgi:hypothetical protein
MFLFLVGAVEMVVISYWTKWVTESKVLASGVITIANVLIWYYILQTMVENINNWQLVALYALGCSAGTMLCTFLSKDSKVKINILDHLFKDPKSFLITK